MSEVLALLAWCAMGLGVLFFLSGAVGLLRFPDLYSRLHAVTKADNAGLGLLALGLALRADSWQIAGLLFVIWLLVLVSGATNCQLLARYGEQGHPHMGEHKVGEGD